MAILNFPTSPTLNQTYSANGKVWTWNGESWVANVGLGYTGSAGTGGGASVTVDDISPISPTAGDLWWNSEQGQLKVYYSDGSSDQWVDASSGQVGDTGYTGSQGIIGYTGSAGPPAVTPASKTSSFTFSLAEANTTTVIDSSSAVQGLIPTNAAVAYPLGTKLRMYRKGTGSVKFVPDTGVTLNLPTGIKPKRTMGTRVKLSANLTGINPTSVYTIPWDAEAWDTDSFHDNAVNNSRITIPSGLGIKKVSLSAALFMTNLSTNTIATIGITKDGSGIYEGYTQAFGTSTGIVTGEFSTASGDIAVVDGSYFSAVTYAQDTSVNLSADRMGFSLTVTEIDAQGFVAYQYGTVEIEKIGTDEWVVTDHSALG